MLAAMTVTGRGALSAEDGIEEDALGQVREARVAGPQEGGARHLEHVVLRARLLRLQAVEQLRAEGTAFCALRANAGGVGLPYSMSSAAAFCT